MLNYCGAGEASFRVGSPACQIPLIAKAPHQPTLLPRIAVALFALSALLAAGPLAKAEGAVVARGSAEQAYVIGATPGQPVTLLHFGNRVGSQDAGPLGGAIFRRVEPGRGYRVRHADR